MKSMLHTLLLTMIVCCWSCSGGKDDPINPTPKPEEKPKIEVTTTAHQVLTLFTWGLNLFQRAQAL